jgi:hypothetical protein
MRTREHQGQITTVAEWAERARSLFILADHDDERGDDFVDLVAYVLHTTVSPRWGLNYKRAGSSQSKDCLAWLRTDDDGSQRFVEVIDVVGGAGGPNPQPAWQDQTSYGTLGNPGTARWFAPTREGWMEPYLAGIGQPQPQPEPGPAPTPTSAPAPVACNCKADLERVTSALVALTNTVAGQASVLAGLNERLDEEWAARVWTGTDPDKPPVAPPVPEFPAYQGSVLGARITLRPVK